jgi:hypothetical protein
MTIAIKPSAPSVHVTKLLEEQVLDYFWAAQADAEVDRLQLLKQLAVVAIARPHEWDAVAVRRACANDNLEADRCFSCRSDDRRLYWHHVIEVHHGGSNSPRNRVALCFRCHQVIHPWLQPWPGDLGPWVRVGEIVEAIANGRYVFDSGPPRRQVLDDDPQAGETREAVS